MLKPNAAIAKALKAYDKGLSVKWNNERLCWEIYYRRPSGQKLITPIVESIYVDGGDTEKFCPLDARILDWLYSADTKRTGKRWKWINRKRYDEMLERRNRRTRDKFANIARDNYNVVNQEMLNPYLTEQSDWVRPDCTSNCRSRVMMRSGANARKARGE